MTATTDYCATDVELPGQIAAAIGLARKSLDGFAHGRDAVAGSAQVECLCPFCGSFNPLVGKACPGCSVEDTDATRTATERRLGNWFILQANNPAAPGINLETLKRLISRQIVTGRSVVRGPSTGQLWRLACKVRGLSREFGQCYSCGNNIDSGSTSCPHCNRLQTLLDEVTVPHPVRYAPREDLLTARDVAKAFDIEFGTTDVTGLLPALPKPNMKMRIAVTAGLILVAGALVWPITSAIAGRSHEQPAGTVAAATSPVASAAPAPVEVRPAELPPIFVSASIPAPNPVEVPIPPVTAASEAASAMTSAEVERPAPAPVAATPADFTVRPPAPVSAQTVVATVASGANEPIETPSEQPASLFNEGLTAESRGDYATAVKVYEQIETLPGEQWPANLKTRLKLARLGARGDLR